MTQITSEPGHAEGCTRLIAGGQADDEQVAATTPPAAAARATGATAPLGISRTEFRQHEDDEPEPTILGRDRYRRRSVSSRWLIRDAVEQAALVETEDGFVDQRTGEILEREWVRPPRPARCSWRVGEKVSVHAGGAMSHFSGLERCGSIWACPVCAAVIRAERAREIGAAVERHLQEEGSILFVTLTIRHSVTDPLRQSIEAVLSSWKKLLQGAAWVGGARQQGMRKQYRVTGYIRSTEITYGVNGWHPHIHALFFTKDRLSECDLGSFGDSLHARWSRFVESATGVAPLRDYGIDVQRVDTSGNVLGTYLSKMQDEGHSKVRQWSASAELARSDAKKGRSGHFVPFELLDSQVDLPVGVRRRLWLEYFHGSRGRRAITWSRGLKEHYEVTDLSDDEIIEDVESAPARWLADGATYDFIRRADSGLLAVALEAAELEDWATVGMLLPGTKIDATSNNVK